MNRKIDLELLSAISRVTALLSQLALIFTLRAESSRANLREAKKIFRERGDERSVVGE
jgi:hypothetical protein